jgi:hypothetical protein
MKNDITIILDRSGSMNIIKYDVIEEFNQFIKEFKTTSLETKFNLIQFNDTVERVIINQKVETIDFLNENNYKPEGCTSLYDAVGDTLNQKIKFLKTKRKLRDVTIAIITDGRENSSKDYSRKMIKELVTKCKEKLNWKILFLAANQNSVLEGERFGIKKEYCKDIMFSKKGMKTAFQTIKYEISK